jgi:hypothetical protein
MTCRVPDFSGAPFLARSLREKACPELAEGWGFSLDARTPAMSLTKGRLSSEKREKK